MLEKMTAVELAVDWVDLKVEMMDIRLVAWRAEV